MAAILSQYSTTGFYKAPVSKGMLGCMFLTSCALNVPLLAHVKQYVVYDISSIFDKYELWRVVASKITFLDTKHLVCGCLLIYYFRIFERRYGSHKFASYLLAASTVATFLELVTVFFLRRLDVHITQLPTGPYGLIFPLFVNYFADIPRVAQTFIMGIPVTGKTLTYLLGIQVMSSNRTYLISGICSLIAGVICRWNIFRVVDFFRIPKFVARLSNLSCGWLLECSPPKEGSIPMGATLEIQTQQRMELLEQQVLFQRIGGTTDRNNSRFRQQMAQGYAERLVMPNGEAGGLFSGFRGNGLWSNVFGGMRNRQQQQQTATVNGNEDSGPSINQNTGALQEDQVRTLLEMGFDRPSIVQALRSCNNDILMATTVLLNKS